MRRELVLFFCAVQFLTRLPTPRLRGFQPDWIVSSTRYFPLVGQLVGGLGAATLLSAAWVWTGWLPVLLALAVTILATGAFHEDGLADACDGLGGGQTADRRLEIMKDSRIGTYGALALIFSVAVRGVGLAALPPLDAALVLIAMQGVGRAAAVAAMALPYAGDPNAAKEGRPARPALINIVLAVLFAAWPLVFLPPVAVAAALILGGAMALGLANLARRLIGGRTGDVLGGVEQLAEIGFVLGASAVLLR